MDTLKCAQVNLYQTFIVTELTHGYMVSLLLEHFFRALETLYAATLLRKHSSIVYYMYFCQYPNCLKSSMWQQSVCC